MRTSGYTVGQVAELAGVTVRTLHHYEQVGLLAPSARSTSGYRIYSAADIDRLSRVLYYRELGFSLEDIATMLDDDTVDPSAHLARQHRLLTERLERVTAMVAAVEREMEAHKVGYNLTPEEKLEVFGDFDPDQYNDEARDRWGETDAWKQSRARTARYTKDDWAKIRAEGDDNVGHFIAAMTNGVAATSAEAMDLAEEHRQHMTRWFFDVSPEFHRCLGEMYVADPRFTATYDDQAPGLAAYIHDAIVANADRQSD